MEEDAAFSVGDDVIASAGARGVIADVREMSNGETVYGFFYLKGSFVFYTEAGLKGLL